MWWPGILILGTVENAMNLLNISPFAQYVVRGLILLAAVIFDRYKQKAKAHCLMLCSTTI